MIGAGGLGVQESYKVDMNNVKNLNRRGKQDLLAHA